MQSAVKPLAGTYSVVLADPGMVGGRIVGASDRIAGYPSTNPYSPCDVAATIFAAVGIDPASDYHDLVERP
jgi:hypothetical protein